MKKTSFIFVCVLLSVFCFSSVSYSESDMELLLEYGEELTETYGKSLDNMKTLLNIQREDGISSVVGERLYYHFLSSNNTLSWVTDIIKMSMWIQKKYLLDYQNYVIIIIKSSQRGFKVDLRMLDKNYGYINKASLLQIVDKRKDIIRSSLEILDKTLKLIKKMDKK
jgi:hypothetical protein